MPRRAARFAGLASVTVLAVSFWGLAAHASDEAEAHRSDRARAHADLDPDNDHQPGPPPVMPQCEQALATAGVRFFRAKTGVRREDGVVTCGAPQAVRYRWGPKYIRYDKNPLVTCQMALALVDFERIVQEEARRHLRSRVRRIEHLGTYNCRKMVRFERRSEHSFANGIDVRRFRLANGETVDVRRDFHPNVRVTKNSKTRFLRAVSRRLYEENVFSSVITPFFDELHRNHIHLDLARYRVDGTRMDGEDRPPPVR